VQRLLNQVPINNLLSLVTLNHSSPVNRRINGFCDEGRLKPRPNRLDRPFSPIWIIQTIFPDTYPDVRIGEEKSLIDIIYICQGLYLLPDGNLRPTPGALLDVRPEYLSRTAAPLSQQLEKHRGKTVDSTPELNTNAPHDQLSRVRAFFLSPSIQDDPMLGLHYQHIWMVSFPIKPGTRPSWDSAPLFVPVSHLSITRFPPLLALVHHLLEEISRFSNKAFRNIGFHTMQVVCRRAGVNRMVRPRWSFVIPCTCSTPRIPSRPPTASSGGRYARGPCGSGTHGPQPMAGSAQPRQPRNADPCTSGNS
jgi:hypothetical protein